ncbi:MAG: glycoside hydrolase family 2 TIM barrel-domain containing protein [Lachnospiraceae bacterium]
MGKTNFNFGWKFYEGEPALPPGEYSLELAEATLLAKWTKATNYPLALSDYDDSDWKEVELPHDFVIEKCKFSKKVSYSTGCLESGYGWYRKTFRVPEGTLSSRVFVKFDGIYRDSQIWCNGDIVARQISGFMGVCAELTEALDYEGENTIAVFCDAREPEGWWYTGGGIYRDATMFIAPKVCVANDSIYVKTKSVNLETKESELLVQLEIDHAGFEDCICETKVSVFDENELKVEACQEVNVSLMQKTSVEIPMTLLNTEFWEPTNPHLYNVCVEISTKYGKHCVKTTFGVKHIVYNPQQGMHLNGKEIFLKGVCGHDDFAGVGVAQNRSIIEYKIAKLKEMGCNAYRCAHNPPSPVFLDVCDEQGILVLDEARWAGVTDIAMDLFIQLVKRDRNHPCVFAWSLCNEEASLQGKDKGVRVFEKMIAVGKKYDDTREYMLAINARFMDAIEQHDAKGLNMPVNGVNYMMLRDFDVFKKLHAKFPEKCFFNTEISSVYNCRTYKMHEQGMQHGMVEKISPNSRISGRWEDTIEYGNVSCYGDSHPAWGETAEFALKAYEGQKHMCGMFIWTGIDYRGETSPYKYPNVISNYGHIDYCGFLKPWGNYLKAYWTDEKVISLMPATWDLFEQEGTPIRVYALANSTEVELFLNGRSLGKQMKAPLDRGYWEVPYQKGSLVAISYEDGVEVARCTLSSSGEIHSLKLTTDKSELIADGCDATVVVVTAYDCDGNEVTNADISVTFVVEGEGRIKGTGNGNYMSHEHDKLPTRNLYCGRAIAIVQSRFEAGEINVSVHSEHAKSDTISLKVHNSLFA